MYVPGMRPNECGRGYSGVEVLHRIGGWENSLLEVGIDCIELHFIHFIHWPLHSIHVHEHFHDVLEFDMVWLRMRFVTLVRICTCLMSS